MNLLEILEENKNIVLTEAIKINTPEEAYNLIKTKQIGVKVESSWTQLLNGKLIDSDEKRILDFLKKVMNVTDKDKVFAVQLVANKVPVNDLITKMNFSSLKEIVACKNKPWAKAIPEYKDIIQFNNKKYNKDEWENVAEKLQNEGKDHGKTNKGGGNKKEIKKLYEDETWGLYIPLSYEGEKAIAYYGKKGEKQIPCNWCTRCEEHYYNTYTFDNTKPMYVLRNYVTGKSYQFAYDKNEVYFLDQEDKEGDEITNGDISSIPDNLLKLIRINNKTLLDFKKEMSRANPRKGEITNPQTDFALAEWSKPKNENGIITQFMTNLNNKEDTSKFTKFLIDGKPVKFDKRNNYLKKYYYEDKPNYFIVAILSKNGNVADHFFKMYFEYQKGKFREINGKDYFNEVMEDNGKLYNTAFAEFKNAYDKREARKENTMGAGTNKFTDKMADKLIPFLEKEFNGYFGDKITVDARYKGVKETNKSDEFVSAGNFLPLGFYINFTVSNRRFSLFFVKDGNSKYIMNKDDEETKEVLSTFNIKDDIANIEMAVNNAIKKFSKVAIHDREGQLRRAYFRGNQKDAINYDRSTKSRLQFEDYFPY